MKKSTPLMNRIKSHLSRNPIPFHTPGHKGRWKEMLFGKRVNEEIPIPGDSGAEFGSLLGDDFDIFRADIADDIDGFPAKIRESEEFAASVYGTRRSLYLVNGSTAGIHSMFLGCLKPGDKVLVARNMHRAVAEALILCGAIPVHVPIRLNFDGIPMNADPNDVELAMKNNPDCRAVYITSPSYYGICADVFGIADVCRKYGKLLFVDEAWGAHFPFHRDLPASAIESGADIVVQSVHKTLPSLTGTSILHICSKNIDIRAIESAKRIVETTSPNLIFYISIENAVAIMAEKGREIISGAIDNALRCRNKIEGYIINRQPGSNPANHNSMRFLGPVENDIDGNRFKVDPTKLILFTGRSGGTLSGIRLSQILEEQCGIYAEMSDVNSIQFVFTGFETDEHVARLMDSFSKIIKSVDVMGIEGLGDLSYNEKKSRRDAGTSEETFFQYSIKIPVMGMPPRKAYFSKKETIKLSESEGRMSAEIVTPYPPGIPILIPGEEITAGIIEYIRAIPVMGGTVRGIGKENGEILIWTVL